jgi:tRNA-guanine family transglycosylase
MSYKIKTPMLWFTQPVDSKPRPWTYFKIEGLMINAYEIIKRNRDKHIKLCGIHKYLNYNGIVMMDSGGFQIMKSKEAKNISAKALLEIYERSKPNIAVILDYPISPGLSRKEIRERQIKTLENIKYMSSSHITSNPMLIPVIHGHRPNDIVWFLRKLFKIGEFDIYGIGSLVPSVFTTRGAGGIYNVIEVVNLVRNFLPDKKIHVFGIGSSLTMHLMFYIGADSVDSSAWRIKAAYGAIQLPGTGDRYITPKKKNRNYKNLTKEEMKKLEKCSCPVCKKFSIDALAKSFELRALHNAWILQEEVKLARELIRDRKYERYVEKILKGSKFYNAFLYAKKLKQKNRHFYI